MQNLDHGAQLDVPAAKRAAKRVQERLAKLGHEVPLSHALEVVAANYGFSNWQTMRATIDKGAKRKSRKVVEAMPIHVRATISEIAEILQERSRLRVNLAPAEVLGLGAKLARLLDTSAPKLVWTSTLEEAYVKLCDWLISFRFQADVFADVLAKNELPPEIEAFSKLMAEASDRMTEAEQALTILHEMAVNGG